MSCPGRCTITRRIYGETTGLKASHAAALERLYRRRCQPEALIPPELADELAAASTLLGRQVGLVLDRKGQVQYVVLGDARGIKLPEFDRFRRAPGKLRGVRFVHVHAPGDELDDDDFTDLGLLYLDAVAVLWPPAPPSRPTTISWAHVLPENPAGKKFEVHPRCPVADVKVDFAALMGDLDDQLETRDRRPENNRGERAFLVHLDHGNSRHGDWDVAELQELARSAGIDVVDTVVQRRRPDPATFIGSGRLNALIQEAMHKGVDLLVFSPELSAAQVRNISRLAEVRVMDRTQLMLDIFAQRARSNDGRIQVELAQLRHILPRLVGAGLAMSRLMGGIGGRGPGETKLEIDRRRIKERILRLEKQLEALSSERETRRRRRQRTGVPVVSIVGYTNAGKSTLLNSLTGATADAEDKLFATLDPFSRRLRFPRDRELVITDTVGFIRNLPRTLLQAFTATLEELAQADLFLHVVDVSNPHWEEQQAAVEQILEDLELEATPRLTVFNKLDKPAAQGMNLPLDEDCIGISARDPATLRPLVKLLEETLERLQFFPEYSDRPLGPPQLELVPDLDEDE